MTITVNGRTIPGSPARIHASGEERDAILRSQELMLAWLRDHPEAPLPLWGHEWLISCRDSAEVVRYAAQLGIKVDAAAAAVRATVRFGPVAYVLYASKAQVAS